MPTCSAPAEVVWGGDTSDGGCTCEVAVFAAAGGLSVQGRGMPASLTVLDISMAAERPGPPHGAVLCLSTGPVGDWTGHTGEHVLCLPSPLWWVPLSMQVGRTGR